MARTSDPDSATSQFFINLSDNNFLDYKSSTHSGWGYTVFGKVIEGMNVVDQIAKVKTGSKEQHRDVPTDPVIIESAVEVK
jgi:peptidyl-prolyl cis-trans isomerase B (cyclophilin B)